MPSTPFPSARPAASPVRNNRQHAVLRAAERLFALRGYHAVTIREIATEARVPTALIGYYFGHKQDLFHAIFVHRQRIHTERLRALDAVVVKGHPLAAQRLVEAFVQPFVDWRQNPEDAHHALLLAREIAQASEEAEPVLQAFVDPLAMRFIDALSELSPGTSREDAAWAYRFALGALLHHLVDERAGRMTDSPLHPAHPCGAARLVDFIVGGVKAILERPSHALPADLHEPALP